MGPGERGAGGAARGVRPGALSALIQEIASAPQRDVGAWEAALRPGAVFGKFELLREIGRGGFGVVWEARDLELGRSVAFKAVRAGGEAGLREERLLREAEAAARLTHPNIVTLFDLGRAEPGPYLVLELLRGQTLEARLLQGRLSLREAVRVAAEIAKGVAHAHSKGVVHRDLKPGNVFLCEDGQVKVLDLGLAHAFGQRRQEGGTPAYMAPEQWEGAPEDERTDVFALGVILFELLTGGVPFADERAQRSSGAAPALEVPDLPGLATLVGRMLERGPVARPRDGQEVAEALRTFQGELERTPSSAPGPVTVTRRPRLRFIGMVAAGVLLGVLAAGGMAWWRERDPPTPVAGADGRIVVAVADFVNDTRDPELDSLSGLLITAMEQSQRLAVLTRTRMLDLARQVGHRDVVRIDEVLGREVGRKAGAAALLVAAVHKLGTIYAVELRAIDPASDQYLFTVKEQAPSKEALFGLLDRLSDRTRSELHEGSAEVRAAKVKVAEATTSSLQAYQHYFRGDQLKESIRYEAAVEEYRKAIAIDPSFALPHYRIAYLGEFLHMDPAARRAEMEEALRHVDRVPAKERLLFQAWKAHMDGRNEEAHGLYAKVLESFPQDKEALFMAGDLYLHQERHAEALPYFERAVVLDPFWEPAMMHVVDCLVALGRGEELMRRSQAWVDRAPSGQSFRALCLAHGLAGRAPEALAAARRYHEIDQTSFSRAHLWEALIFDERYGEAEALARRSGQLPGSKVDALYALPMLITSIAYQGRRQEALRLLDAAPADMEDRPGAREGMRLELTLGDGNVPPVMRAVRAEVARPGPPNPILPFVLALLGDQVGAEALSRKIPVGLQLELYQAAAAWRRGELERAAAMLQELTTRPAAHETRGPALWTLAKIAAERGRDREVIAAVDRLRLAPGGAWRSWGWPQALLLKARAQERLGETGPARETLDHLLGIWKRADPDLPHLAEAREMRARLAKAPAPAPRAP